MLRMCTTGCERFLSGLLELFMTPTEFVYALFVVCFVFMQLRALIFHMYFYELCESYILFIKSNFRKFIYENQITLLASD